MTYEEALDFLYNSLPVFQKQGPGAYKPGLGTTLALAEAFGNPHQSYAKIHVGGTNGKGSVSHSIASVLQAAGYRVGLFTSPHLVDFRERIKVDGRMISREEVVDFVERYDALNLPLSPSFFELTTVMAFDYFAKEKVDFAVVEVGLGGRLDSTNIIQPLLSVITNISRDHTALLGDTPEQIASEKAGIIKPGVPVVVGESEGAVRKVFIDKAAELKAPIRLADSLRSFSSFSRGSDRIKYETEEFGTVEADLTGECQERNMATILTALKTLEHEGVSFTAEDVRLGLSDVQGLTGLMGRWMKVGDAPKTVCDTGHNEGGWQYLWHQIDSQPGTRHVVVGFVNDKDIDSILKLMGRIRDARFYFTRPSVPRGLPAEELAAKAAETGLSGETFTDVKTAVKTARQNAAPSDFVFVGGSTFVVADLLA